jgi:2-polyprenyl-3-methyl-5-hydroxy-6-metoxy-1,4-benzoquinol methylase
MEHFKLPNSLVVRERFILDACRGKSVLHLGCADFPYTDESIASGSWLHSKVSDVAATCIGVDLDGDTVERLKEKHGVDNVKEGNAEELDKLNGALFDVILAGEIVEHLNNPGLFFDTARTVLKPGGKLLITVPSAFSLRRFIRIPFGSESVHPDHAFYFSHTTLHTLARRYGYVLTEAHSYRLPNKKPLVPWIFERMATVITPNWGEGIIHLYSLPNGTKEG